MVVHRRCTHLTDTYTLPVPVHVTWVIYPVGHTCALGWYRWYTMSPWGTHSVCGVQHVMHGVTLPVPHTDIPHYGWIPTWVHHPVDTWSWGDTPDPGWIPCWGIVHGMCSISRMHPQSQCTYLQHGITHQIHRVVHHGGGWMHHGMQVVRRCYACNTCTHTSHPSC